MAIHYLMLDPSPEDPRAPSEPTGRRSHRRRETGLDRIHDEQRRCLFTARHQPSRQSSRTKSPLLSSTSKSQSLSHTRSPHAVFSDALVLIDDELGWFEIFWGETKSGKTLRFGWVSLLVQFLHGEDMGGITCTAVICIPRIADMAILPKQWKPRDLSLLM
jgi:hypothetical protein